MGQDAMSRAPLLLREEEAPCLTITTTNHSSDILHSFAEIVQAQQSDKTVSCLKAEPKNRKIKEQQGVLYRQVSTRNGGGPTYLNT